jgi:hypothetical protein
MKSETKHNATKVTGTSHVSLEQRTVATEEEVRNALRGLNSMGLMAASAPPKDHKLVRVVLVIETPEAPKADERTKRRGSPLEVTWNPFGW